MVEFQEPKSGCHVMHVLLEVDVTVARKFIEVREAYADEKLSFTVYLISCLT
jgi:hypothetical protein